MKLAMNRLLCCVVIAALVSTQVYALDVGAGVLQSEVRQALTVADITEVSHLREAKALEVPEVSPVPTTARCIVIMCCQYMIVFVALAVCRTHQEFTGTSTGKVDAGLKAAAQTVTHGPMLCVLFIAYRMRVEFLSDGKDQPQLWVQYCMYSLTFSVLASTILALVMPFVTGKPLAIKEGAVDLEEPQMENDDSKVVFYALATARYVIFFGLYGGIAGVIVGICTYIPSSQFKPGADLEPLPSPAPAVTCTMILAVAFFLTQLVIAACRSYSEFKGVKLPNLIGVMTAAATAMEFAPMLAILFLAARMRARQHDSDPQDWAQRCMYASTGTMILSALLAIAIPAVMGGTLRIDPATKESTLEVPDPRLGYVMIVMRYLLMAGFYGGAVGVIYSIFTFEAPAGPEATLPVSPTVECVINMTVQFFVVYLLLTLMLTVSELSGGRCPLEQFRIYTALDAAKSTLAFAPMLSILFVTTRMYALLITDNKGAPPGWVQDGMYMSTWALMISFLSCLAVGLTLGKVETDEDGNVVNKFEYKLTAVMMTILRYLTMFLLYGGICIVIVGLFVMTPTTANGRGAVLYESPVGNSTLAGTSMHNAGGIRNASGNA